MGVLRHVSVPSFLRRVRFPAAVLSGRQEQRGDPAPRQRERALGLDLQPILAEQFRGIADEDRRPAPMRDVAACSLEKHYYHLRPERTSDDFLHVVDPVRRDPGWARRGMTRIVDDAARQFPVAVPDADDTHFRIGWASASDDVRITLARMCEGAAVLHAEAEVERHLILQTLAESATDLRASAVGVANGRDNFRSHAPQVFRINARRMKLLGRLSGVNGKYPSALN